jgi:hypothetical protein
MRLWSLARDFFSPGITFTTNGLCARVEFIVKRQIHCTHEFLPCFALVAFDLAAGIFYSGFFCVE